MIDNDLPTKRINGEGLRVPASIIWGGLMRHKSNLCKGAVKIFLYFGKIYYLGVKSVGIISGKGRTRGEGERGKGEEGTGREGEEGKGGNEGERGATRGRKEEVVNGNSSWSQEEFLVKEAEQGNHVPTKSHDLSPKCVTLARQFIFSETFS